MLIGLGLLLSLIYYSIQPPNNFSVNEKADANEYLKIYAFFDSQTPWENVRFGIHNRMVVPYLATLVPGEDTRFQFFVVNTLFALLSLMAIFYLLDFLEIKLSYIFIALTFFSLHYVGPFRQNAIGPINVDIPVYLFEVLLVLGFLKKNYLLPILLAPVAVATKELFIAYYLMIFFVAVSCRIFLKNDQISMTKAGLALIVAVVTKMILNHYFPSATPSRNSLLVIAFHLREMLQHPQHLWMWSLSIFAAFGGFIFLIVKKNWRFQINNTNHVVIHALAFTSLLLSIIGGMDYTRLIFIGFPYIILSVFLLSKPQEHEVWVAGFISIALSRFWMLLPVISQDLSPYRWWMPESSDTIFLFGWTFTLIVCYFLFLALRKLSIYLSESLPRT
jgi:hypothetical protein